MLWKEKNGPGRRHGRDNRNLKFAPENEDLIMFRKIALIAVPAMAIVLTLFASDNSSSQAFARGGRGGHGGHSFSHNHRGFNRNFRHNNRYGWNRYGWNRWNRYGWGYGYGGYGFNGYGYETPVCSTCEPVAPVCATCEPVYSGFDGGYGGYFGGYGRFRNHYRNHGHFFGHGGHRGGGRRR